MKKHRSIYLIGFSELNGKVRFVVEFMLREILTNPDWEKAKQYETIGEARKELLELKKISTRKNGEFIPFRIYEL